MAKPKSLAKAARELSANKEKEIQAVYFRMDRTSTYAWQPFRLTIFTDGSMVEDLPFKEDLIHITIRKMGEEMRESGHEYYERIKKQRLEDERKAEIAARA